MGMEIPYDGKVNIRLVVKRFRKKVFYYVDRYRAHGEYSLKPCMLSKSSSIGFPFVHFFDDEFKLDYSMSRGTHWKHLFDSYEEAEKECKRLNQLYQDGFRRIPFLKIDKLEEHKDNLLQIERDINKLLAGFENFDGIDFCDVSAGGIQIRGFHKQVDNYCYGDQITIKYDFSNADEVVMEFVEMWYRHDTDQKLYKTKELIKSGEKYGWD